MCIARVSFACFSQIYMYLHDNPSAKSAKLNGPAAPGRYCSHTHSELHTLCLPLSLPPFPTSLPHLLPPSPPPSLPPSPPPSLPTEQLSASELKKLHRKQKKAQLKAQAARAAEEKTRDQKPHGKGGATEEDKKSDEKEMKFDPGETPTGELIPYHVPHTTCPRSVSPPSLTSHWRRQSSFWFPSRPWLRARQPLTLWRTRFTRDVAASCSCCSA